VVFPAPADADPGFWQPAVNIIADYQQADLVLSNGAGYAKWLNRVSLSRRKGVDTSAAFRDQYIHLNDGVTHSHGAGGDHSHSGTAFTTWLDFKQATAQARAITAALTRQRPTLEAVFLRNFTALEADLLRLDKQLQMMVATKPGLPLLASHPVYPYFRRAYGLNLQSLMWEPDETPSAAQWAELARRLKQHPARWMLWESEPDPRSVEQLRGMGVESIVFNPAARRPNSGDFLSVMRRNVKNLQAVFD